MAAAAPPAAHVLPGVQAGWSPQILLMGSPSQESYAGRFIYVEHGQEYDPFLWLYLRYAVLDLLRGGHLHREAHFGLPWFGLHGASARARSIAAAYPPKKVAVAAA